MLNDNSKDLISSYMHNYFILHEDETIKKVKRKQTQNNKDYISNITKEK